SGRKPALAEVEQQIAADLSRELALDDLVKRANSIEDAIAGGASLEDAAAEGGAKVRKLEPIDPAAKLQAGTPVTGLPQDSRFIETLFTLEKGATSPLTETDGGGYFMVRV
ncbi:MAG: parvulin peptidyl-prolyl isomerase, partial [Alphaproteobacteria bacterium]